jgi:hypothetical protein
MERVVITIPVDARGCPQREPSAPPGEPLLLFGAGLLALPGLLDLLRRLGRGESPLYLATDQLYPTADPPRALTAAGLRAIEVPLPTADALRFDEIAGTAGGLARTVSQARAWWEAAVDLLVRVPVGVHNRSQLAELARLLTGEIVGVQRVLFHCSPSLGNSHPGPADESPLRDLSARLYDQAVELESARIRVRVEHRDGFGLCLFASQPEPLRYFRPASAEREPTDGDPVWIYPLSAPAAHLVQLDACAACALRQGCRGLHRGLVGKPGVGQVTPYTSDTPQPPISRPQHSIFSGAPRRLRGSLGLAEAWQQSAAGKAVSSQEPLEIGPDDVRTLGLDRIHLDGFHLILVRVPWMGSAAEPLVPSLALTALVPFLRAAGVRVDPVDAKLELGQSTELTTLMTQTGGRRTDVALDVEEVPRAERQRWDRLATTLVEQWPVSADLLGLSMEVAECLPLALALVRAWKRHGGGAVVMGGRGLSDPRRLMTLAEELDFCVSGEGEVPLLLLADALRGRRRLGEVPGLLYRSEDGRLEDTHCVVHSLDLHPEPDVSGLALDAYDGVSSLGTSVPVFLYQFIVGCPHACAFCGEHNRYRYRVRSPERVVRDLRFVVEVLDRRRIFFVNNLINVSRRYLDAWLDAMELAQLPIQWCDCCRPAGIHVAQLRRMRRVGCRTLTWGLDMLSQPLNKRLWKNLNLERAAALLREAQALGIRNAVNVIMGMPTETEEDVQETIRFLLRHADCFDEVSVGVYGFRERSPLGRWPARFGLRRAADGVDEVGGRRWEALLREGKEAQERVIEAVRHAVPAIEPGRG